jgi:hypothetical protein
MTARRLGTRVAVVAASLPVAVALAAPALAEAGTGTATVGVASDAWYAVSSACTAGPTGCLPAAPPVSAYPAGTLHIGVAAGQEESRTYLALNLSALPSGTTLVSGLLRLPVGSAQEGSRVPDTATLQACLATGAFADTVDGSPEAPPKVDCKAASAVAKYVAAAGTQPEMLTIDLAPFVAALATGTASTGIALLPAADTPPETAWHVALSAHERSVPAAQRVSATVSYASAGKGGAVADPVPDAAPPAATPPESGSISFGAPPLVPVTPAQAPSTPISMGTAASGPVGPTAPVSAAPAQAVGVIGGYAYPGVFLLPIIFAAACGWLARALTRDLAPGLGATASGA